MVGGRFRFYHQYEQVMSFVFVVITGVMTTSYFPITYIFLFLHLDNTILKSEKCQ